MTVAERLRAILEPLPPGAAVTLPADVLRAWLAEDAPESRRTATDAVADLTVAEVAGLFARGRSTVRTWLCERRFPNAYRLRGREWRIPPADVAAMQRAQAEEYRQASRPAAEPEPTDLGAWRRQGKGVR